ncbi:MAG TPA: hypothetical protein VIF62_13645 [Labilithrix sp.]|jgi:hypothetical protein
MAEEKKPKIDLKARLGKANVGGATPPPPAAGGIPAPAISAPNAGTNNVLAPSTPQSSPRPPNAGLPVPPGIAPPPAMGRATPGVALDPTNPLAAAMAPQRAPISQAPKAPPQPQRIEVDEMAVQVASRGAFKKGLIAGVVVAAVLGAVGFIAGGANETSKGRQQSVTHAKELANDVQKARDQLKTIADKTDDGRKSLLAKKFPDNLAKDLGGINVDFDGGKLAGVRFSGFSQDTASGLIEFITAVQTLNDRKNATTNLLTHLQKPITEAFAGGQKISVGYIVLLGGGKDPAGNPFGVLASLQKPIEVADPSKLQLPTEFTATNPMNGANVTAPAYKAGDLSKPSGIYVVPKSISAACPSETTGQVAQLGGQLSHLVNDIRGDTPVPGAIEEPKPGLLERADKLIQALNKVQ